MQNSVDCDYDRSIIRIPNDPFRYFKCPKQESTRKRALSIDVIRKIYALPYLDETKANHRRYNLAKDCFIISFCLIGMNSVDLFKVMTIEEKTLVYNRTKTKERRSDEALMKVDILPFVEPLLEKYYSETSQSIFRFSQDYSTPENFNRAINLGLKDVGSDVGLPSRFPKSFSRRQNSLQEFLFTIMQTHLIADEYKNFGQLK